MTRRSQRRDNQITVAKYNESAFKSWPGGMWGCVSGRLSRLKSVWDGWGKW